MRFLVVVVLLLTLVDVSWAKAKEDAVLRDTLRDLIASGDYANALQRADAALAQNADSALAMQYRAYALHQLGRSGEARRAYEKTVELAPDNWWAHMNLGSLLASTGRFSEALTAATRATELKPDSKDAWRRVVRIQRDRRLFEKAKSAVVNAMGEGIDPAWCQAQLAELAWIANDRETATKRWARAAELGFDAKAVAHGRRLVAFDEQIR
ncbi:MAG: tetratricopeptide repeat protein, partial [Phycisphaeraceae bacterium]|nr:tetratricopeptide repeat protein [Phycisphaeraceae bacterium]